MNETNIIVILQQASKDTITQYTGYCWINNLVQCVCGLLVILCLVLPCVIMIRKAIKYDRELLDFFPAFTIGIMGFFIGLLLISSSISGLCYPRAAAIHQLLRDITSH